MLMLSDAWKLGTNAAGWPTIILSDGSERWPNSVWRSPSAAIEHALLRIIVEAHNAARGAA